MSARSGLLLPAGDPFRPEADEHDPAVTEYATRTMVGVAAAAWDLGPWKLKHDAAGRCWRASVYAEGLTLAVEGETVAEVREAVLRRRGQDVRVP